MNADSDYYRPGSGVTAAQTDSYQADSYQTDSYQSDRVQPGWPDQGTERGRTDDGVFLGTVDWPRNRVIAEGGAFAAPGSREESAGYWQAAYRARRRAISNMEVLLQKVADTHHARVDPEMIHLAAIHALVAQRDYDRGTGQFTLRLAASLFGPRGAYANARLARAERYAPDSGAAIGSAADPPLVLRREPRPEIQPPIRPEPPIQIGPSIQTEPSAQGDDTVNIGADTPPAVYPVIRPSLPSRPGVGLDATPAGQTGPFTGVVIDTRGLGLLSSMSPKIHTPDGQEVWGTVKVDHDYAVEVGIAGFMESYDRALAYERRVGTHPMIIRAIGVTGGRMRSEAIISDDDAAWMKRENDRTHFLDQFHVMFVVDPLPE